MSTEENKAVVRRLLQDVWNRGDLDRLVEIVAPQFIRHGPMPEDETRGPQGVGALISAYRATYPDLRVTVEDQIAEGSLVVTRWAASGTHRGELMGIAPTGRQIAVPGVIVDRIGAGKIEVEWAYYDAMRMFRQLGVAPPVGRG
jgi:steroid delta-isomerase-like uncharacterized protein